ncbi:phosphocholine-specific phospholipase C [Demetria terragena]|uniref:phosphocholine-specific phospholipase C n=1 Tax=Demetria terragena TaxID=63959 RepID=UPI000382614E|nr:phospholipase C, phosphocholine-specific [Demetria terragena]
MTSHDSPEGATRRQVFKTAGAAAGTAALGSFLPPSVHRAMATPMRAGGLDAIENVILLMQENRSFDHYYGTLRGVRGYGDRNPLRRRAGDSVLRQAGQSGDVLPFSLRAAAKAAGRPATDIQYLSDLPHGFTDATDAWSRGWWDAWVPHKGKGSMTFYDRQDIGLQYELADTFTILDAYHCSVYGSTNPNRNYFFSGTTGQEADGKRAVTNAAYNKDHPGYDWTCYPERLETAGVSWQIYQEWDNFTDNAVEYFATFKAIGAKVLKAVDGPFRTTEEFYESLSGKSTAEQDRLLRQLEQGRASLTSREQSLFSRGMYRSRPGTLLTRIAADIAGGSLPQVTWVVPTAALSEHPGASTPVGSAGLIYDLLDIVASDKRTWSKTAMFINFDENDGYFDHVPPPVAPRPSSGNGDDWFNGRPIGFGPRVPMTVVSPWTVGGHVDSSLADHTSALQFLERWTGVKEPNISAWRRQVAGDLTSAFDFTCAGRPPSLKAPKEVPAKVTRWQPDPPEKQSIPHQESGHKPARRTPYASTATVQAEAGKVTVTICNDGSTSAPYAIYPFGGEAPEPVHCTVAAGQREQVTLPTVDGRWDVVVQGPDRFWFEATGAESGAAAKATIEPRVTGSRLAFRIRNDRDSKVVFDVNSLAYQRKSRTIKVHRGRVEVVRWTVRDGWYDIEFICAKDPSFRQRFSGRIQGAGRSVTA